MKIRQLLTNWLGAADADRRMTLRELSHEVSISYTTLKMAAWQGRLESERSGNIYLSTISAVDDAIARGDLRGK